MSGSMPKTGFALSQRSLDRLTGIHPDLVRVVKVAIQITSVDFAVGEGLRTIERQRQLVRQGASRTMNSRHLTGHAIDLIAYIDGDHDGDKEVSWHWPLYLEIAKAMKTAAKQQGVALTSGVDWKMMDGPHHELSWSHYPK